MPRSKYDFDSDDLYSEEESESFDDDQESLCQDFSTLSCTQQSPSVMKEEENLFDLALGITKNSTSNNNHKLQEQSLSSVETTTKNVHEAFVEQFFSSSSSTNDNHEIDFSSFSFFQMLISSSSAFNSTKITTSFSKPPPIPKQIASQKTKKTVESTEKKISSTSCQKRPKAELTVAVVGHVDCGKSTLIGQLLVQSGAVLGSAVEKLAKEAKSIGKSSFEYAWLLDDDFNEERQRGITKDICTVQLTFPQHHQLSLNVIDCPGHVDFIPNAIHGIIQADVGLLVVDLTAGEAETGLANQTREHLLVLKAAALTRQLVVLLNKADKVNWSCERVQEVKMKMEPLLEQLEFLNVHYVVASGLKGENLVHSHLQANSPSLVQTLSKLTPEEKAHFDEFNLRIVVNDIVKSSFIQGTVCTGRVHRRDKLVISPGSEQISVKSLFLASNESKSIEECVSGQNILIALSGKETEILSSVQRGFVLSAFNKAVASGSSCPIACCFEAEIETFELPEAITLGWQATIHIHGMQESVMISKLYSCKSLWNDSRETKNVTSSSSTKKHPRFIPSNCSAVVECKMNVAIPLDLFETCPQTGIFLLRSNGKTLVSGKVTRIK